MSLQLYLSDSYAVKQLLANADQEREALKSVQKLKHDYIVTFHGCFVHKNVVHIVMDYCEVGISSHLRKYAPQDCNSERITCVSSHSSQHQTLEHLIKKKKRNGEPTWPDETIKKWACQLMEVLIYMKGKDSMVHNDIKPE